MVLSANASFCNIKKGHFYCTDQTVAIKNKLTFFMFVQNTKNRALRLKKYIFVDGNTKKQQLTKEKTQQRTNVQNCIIWQHYYTKVCKNLNLISTQKYVIFLCDIIHYFPQYLPARAYLALSQHSPLAQGMHRLGRILHPPSQWMFVLIVLLRLL